MFLDGERIAWVPSGMTPTQHQASIILAVYEERREVLSRDDVRKLFNED